VIRAVTLSASRARLHGATTAAADVGTGLAAVRSVTARPESALRQLWMPQRPKPLVRCDQAFLGPMISHPEAARPLGNKFEHLQQGNRDFDVPLIAA
jgi:hypothetical protein